MAHRLPELSYRMGHHLPQALPFFIPFYNKLIDAGFDIDERRIKPVLRRNGQRIVMDYSKGSKGTSVTFRLYGQTEPIATVDLDDLVTRIHGVRKVKDYAEIDGRLDQIVHKLENATPSPR